MRQKRLANQNIEGLIVRALQEVMEVLNGQHIGSVDSDTRIFGRNGLLDSMGLVTLITDLEEMIEEELGVPLILVDDRAMSQEKSPFRTISSLIQYVSMLVEEENQHEGS